MALAGGLPRQWLVDAALLKLLPEALAPLPQLDLRSKHLVGRNNVLVRLVVARRGVEQLGEAAVELGIASDRRQQRGLRVEAGAERVEERRLACFLVKAAADEVADGIEHRGQLPLHPGR